MSDLNGPFGWLTPTVARLTAAEPDFWRAAFAMDGPALHLLGLILSHASTASFEERDWRALAHALQFAPRRELARVHAPSVPLSALNLTRKLAAPLWHPATYRALARLCRDNNARKWLAHTARIAPRDLLILIRLPPAFRTEAFVGQGRHGRELAEVRYRIAMTRRAHPELPDHAIARMLEQSDTWRRPRDFRVSLIKGKKFPAAPWKGDDALHPIRDYSELERTALSFRNCVRTYALDILEERCALYIYCAEGRQIAVVEIVRDAIFGWEVNEVSGPGNDRVAPAHRVDICRRLVRAGISGGRELPFPAMPMPSNVAAVA